MHDPFGPVWGASGVQGFYGEGYPFHRWLERFPIGFGFEETTFVAKTATRDPRPGNMPLDGIRPKERLPRCVHVQPLKVVALNAVGLSNPGLETLLAGPFPDITPWQERQEPFQISLMSLATTPESRIQETRDNLELIARVLPNFRTQYLGIQINISCPNVGVEHGATEDTENEILDIIDLAWKILGNKTYLIIKLPPTFPPQSAVRFSNHAACWGICFSNTVPWRSPIPWLSEDSPLQIKWDQLFGRNTKSPLQRRGFEQPGGLSGQPLLPITCEWIRQAREDGVLCHINGGGGILHPRDVFAVFAAGADSISLGSIAFLRPWRLQDCILQAWREYDKTLTEKIW